VDQSSRVLLAIDPKFLAQSDEETGHLGDIELTPDWVLKDRHIAVVGSSFSSMRNPKLMLRKSRLSDCPETPISIARSQATLPVLRSDSIGTEIDANPSAPGPDIVPHQVGCRQVVLSGGQRAGAALCAPRGRPLG
jgi:hypothetical protein